jgi:hypothetical protein
MICLGASMAPFEVTANADRNEPRTPAASWALLLTLGGVLLGAVYFVGDQRIDRAMSRRDPDAVAAAARSTPWDPVAANIAAAAYANFDGDEPSIRESLKWMERAHDREPNFPFYLNKIAQLRFMLGDRAGAQQALEQALALQPWNVQTLQLAYQFGDGSDDDSFSESARERLCTMGPTFCP